MCLLLYSVSEVLFTALEGLIFFIVFAILSNRKEFIPRNYFKAFIFVLIYTIYTYWITLFLPTGVHTILIGFLTFIILNYMFDGTIFKSIIKILCIFLGMSITETLIVLSGMLILNLPLNSMLENKFYSFLLSIIAKVIEAIAIFIIYKRNLNMSWLNDSTPGQSKYKHILTIISTFIFLTVMINISIIDNPKNLIFYNIFSTVIYLVLIIFMFSAFHEGSKLEIIQFASEIKKENIQQLVEFNEMVAKERHEYKNHLNTIYGLCTLNKPDLSEKIKQYINNYANNSETRNIVIDSGNDFVDAIINVKYNNALRKGIEVLVDFEVPLSDAKIDENVAVTIISNIIENAFESIVLAQQEKKYINIQTYIENSIYYISISNNGPMILDADKKKIFSAGFSTKDNSAKKRGFGLSIVQTEIERCGGNITINSTEEVTEFLISLKVNAQQAVV